MATAMAGDSVGADARVTVLAARELVAELGQDVGAFAQGMLDHQASHLDPVRDEPEVRALTLATCAAHIEALLAMMRLGIPATRTETPVVALEHARRMAAQGLSIDDLMRVYRLGQAYFWEQLSARLIERIEDRAELGAALQQTAAVTFGYSDTVSTRVSLEHMAEVQRRQRQATARRVDVVRDLMAGEPVDVEAAERTLGYRLAGPQLAFLCWAEDEGRGIEAAALAVARAVGAERPLLLPADQGGVAAWATAASGLRLDLEAIRRAAAAAVPGVHVALGEVGLGIEGFRASRSQADRARRIAALTPSTASTATRWSDVALADLLARDLDAARELVVLELGSLAERGEVAAKLRGAMLAYLNAQGSHVGAAAILGVHRNTALYRLHRAEELRGRPITERQLELHVALRLCALLGDRILPG